MLSTASYESLCAKPEVREIIQNYINQLNEPLASYETIKDFAILPADFSIETGELTPSMKVKRKYVEQKYADLLNAFYTQSLQKM